MIAVTGKSDPGNVKYRMFARVGGQNYLLVDGIDNVPEGWNRVPLVSALQALRRSDTEWVSPDTATAAWSVMGRLDSEWVSNISEMRPGDKIDKKNSTLTGGVPARSNICDLADSRKRKARYK